MVNKIAGITIIIMGVGSTVGGYVVGPLADKKGGLMAGRIGLILFAFTCGVFIIAYRWQSI